MGMEKYTPTPEEMKAAEEHLTPEQEKGSRYREKYFEELKAIFESRNIPLENLREIDLKIIPVKEEGASHSVLTGTINGHAIEIKTRIGGASGAVDGMGLRSETAKEILDKYLPVAQALESYNEFQRRSRNAQQRELEEFDEQQKLGAILKDIL